MEKPYYDIRHPNCLGTTIVNAKTRGAHPFIQLCCTGCGANAGPTEAKEDENQAHENIR